MSPIKLKFVPIVVAGLLCVVEPVLAASAQPVGIDAENRAKLARVKAQGSAIAGTSDSKQNSSGESNSCSLEIGNINTGGSRGRAPREVNIFIPGDIFQVNNRCR